jgi:uncharacterized membrane protein
MQEREREDGLSHIRRSITIGADAEAILRAWRDPATLAAVAEPVATFVSADGATTHWQVRTPFETRAIAMRRLDASGASVRDEADGGGSLRLSTELSVRPAPADRGNEATLVVDYHLPGGGAAEASAKLFGAAPDLVVAKILRRLKALLEAGEMPTLEANPSARERDDD